MRTADSTVSQFRSFIFFSAISAIWARVTLPAKPPLPGVLEPEPGFFFVSRPAAFFRK